MSRYTHLTAFAFFVALLYKVGRVGATVFRGPALRAGTDGMRRPELAWLDYGFHIASYTRAKENTDEDSHLTRPQPEAAHDWFRSW